MDIAAQVKASLEKEIDATEISEVKTFRCVYKLHILTLQFTDSGNPNDNYRYHLAVYREDADGYVQRVGRGNGGKTIDMAISVFHWSNLDL